MKFEPGFDKNGNLIEISIIKEQECGCQKGHKKIKQKKMITPLRSCIIAVIAIAGILIAFSIVSQGIKKSEINECLKWQEQAKQYPDFFMTGWQVEQCEHYGIRVLPEQTDEATPDTSLVQSGLASWYDYSLNTNDQKCRADDCYSKHNDTCASRDYERGSKLRVFYYTDEIGDFRVGKWVDCIVNDYGPEEWTGRDIDLSSHAFAQLAPLAVGIINNVEVELIN